MLRHNTECHLCFGSEYQQRRMRFRSWEEEEEESHATPGIEKKKGLAFESASERSILNNLPDTYLTS